MATQTEQLSRMIEELRRYRTQCEPKNNQNPRYLRYANAVSALLWIIGGSAGRGGRPGLNHRPGVSIRWLAERADAERYVRRLQDSPCHPSGLIRCRFAGIRQVPG
jgi:hypothetical protein